MHPVVTVVAALLVVYLAGYALYLLTRREPVMPHFVTLYITDSGGQWSWRCQCGVGGDTTSELARVMAKAHLREVKA